MRLEALAGYDASPAAVPYGSTPEVQAPFLPDDPLAYELPVRDVPDFPLQPHVEMFYGTHPRLPLLRRLVVFPRQVPRERNMRAGNLIPRLNPDPRRAQRGRQLVPEVVVRIPVPTHHLPVTHPRPRGDRRRREERLAGGGEEGQRDAREVVGYEGSDEAGAVGEGVVCQRRGVRAEGGHEVGYLGGGLGVGDFEGCEVHAAGGHEPEVCAC